MKCHLRYLFLAAILAVPGSLYAGTSPVLAEHHRPTLKLGPAPRIPLEAVPQEAPVSLASAPPLSAFSVDTTDRELVRSFYNTVFTESEDVPSSWTGSYNPLAAGSISQERLDATLLRINFFRAMAGVPSSIQFSSTNNNRCQNTALMMSSDNVLVHLPDPMTQLWNLAAWWPMAGIWNQIQVEDSWWRFINGEAKTGAANSNLALGSSGPEAIFGYMQDPGNNNATVGHRQWILHPPTRTMGAGDVDGDPFTVFSNSLHESDYSPKETNALWIFDGNILDPYPPLRDGFVAWPPPGYIPSALTFARWSFHVSNADFSTATVSMSKGGNPVATEVVNVPSSFGEHFVWVPDGKDTNTLDPVFGPPPQDETYQVNVSNVMIGGLPKSFQYSVTVFDAAQPGPGFVPTSISGSSTPVVGLPNYYEVSGPHYADQYEWRLLDTETAGWVEEANNLDRVTTRTGNYVVSFGGESNATGKVFKLGHLNSPVQDTSDQIIRFNSTFVPGPNAKIQFDSKLGFSSSTQHAKVQVSTNDGASWVTLYDQAGRWDTEGLRETFFTTRFVDLSAYQGKTIIIRFAYTADYGTFAAGAGNETGWAVDNVLLTDCLQVVSESIGIVGPDQTFSLNPANTDSGLLQARCLAWGGRPQEWGPTLALSPTNNLSVAPAIGNWDKDPRLGWLFGVDNTWSYHPQIGYLHLGSFPWIFQSNFGWSFFVNRPSAFGIWLFDADLGYLFVDERNGGWFQYEPFSASDWDNFLSPQGNP